MKYIQGCCAQNKTGISKMQSIGIVNEKIQFEELISEVILNHRYILILKPQYILF